jgi:hypothetical protein
MGILFFYLIIGVIIVFIFDVLNDYVLRPPDKIQFDWGTRIINILIWPYILGIFIMSFVRFISR